MMDIVVANGFVMERCTFFSREYCCCVLHNTRCKCEDYNPRNSKPLTNYDLLIRKSPEELAEWLWFKVGKCPPFDVCPSQVAPCEAKDCWLDWLKEEENNI